MINTLYLIMQNFGRVKFLDLLLNLINNIFISFVGNSLKDKAGLVLKVLTNRYIVMRQIC